MLKKWKNSAIRNEWLHVYIYNYLKRLKLMIFEIFLHSSGPFGAVPFKEISKKLCFKVLEANNAISIAYNIVLFQILALCLLQISLPSSSWGIWRRQIFSSNHFAVFTAFVFLSLWRCWHWSAWSRSSEYSYCIAYRTSNQI